MSRLKMYRLLATQRSGLLCASLGEGDEDEQCVLPSHGIKTITTMWDLDIQNEGSLYSLLFFSVDAVRRGRS